jgi:hypothetical protein
MHASGSAFELCMRRWIENEVQMLGADCDKNLSKVRHKERHWRPRQLCKLHFEQNP